jgi:ubiquinone/menaquinone biosynthesis C-methylase UbiE
MHVPVLSTQAFYTKINEYIRRVDPTWIYAGWEDDQEEMDHLSAILGQGEERRALDCSCGDGNQAVALAKLGWQVTATDFTEADLDLAKQRARQQNLTIDFRACDMRLLGEFFQSSFDWVVTCMALDNISENGGILQALMGISAALKPGGKCYIRLRDIEHERDQNLHYEFRKERIVPYGRVILIEDWDFFSEEQVIHIYAYLREDIRHPEYWESDVFAHQRRVLGKKKLVDLLQQAGFVGFECLPQISEWHPYEVVAEKT